MSGTRRWIIKLVAARPANPRPASTAARARRFIRETIKFRLQE